MRNNNIKIYFIIVIVSLLSITVSYGQDTLLNKKKTLLVKFNPYLLFGDYITTSMSIPLGIEVRINNKLSYDQYFSYIFNPGGRGGLLIIHTKETKGIRTDSEIKRYLNKRNNFTGFYLATHLLYQYTEAITSDYDGGLNVLRNLFALHETPMRENSHTNRMKILLTHDNCYRVIIFATKTLLIWNLII